MSFVVIWSGEHHAYWRPGGEGYTTQFSAAGLYTMEDAEQWTSGCGPEKKIDIRSFEVECALHSNATVIAHLRSEGIRDPDLWQVQVDGHDEREGAFCTEREAQAEVVRVCTELAVDAERERIPERAAGGAAFPNRGDNTPAWPHYDGMMLRDYFAAHASEADVSYWTQIMGHNGHPVCREEAKYVYADRMLAARAPQPRTEGGGGDA